MAPALVSGNTVVFKPASLTPLTAALIVEIFDECGLPPGVLNLVYGGGREVGDTIVRHPAILAVSFTGSNDVGVGLYGAAAARGIKCQCEMGGKNPIVVLGDADLDLAVESTVQGAFGSTGQRCTATSRAVVVDNIANEFVERLAARTASLVVGNGLNPATNVGPSVDERQLETVLSYVETGQHEGARLVRGGERIRDEGRDRGYFVSPAIFDHVDANMRIAQEEIFGPVLSLIRVPDNEVGALGRQQRPLRPVGIGLHQRRLGDVQVRRPAGRRHPARELPDRRRRGAHPVRRDEGDRRRAA